MLTIQFGQCGNQLGHSLFSFLSNDIDLKSTAVPNSTQYQYAEQSSERWFSGLTKDNKRIAKTILVDTEKKFINNVPASSSRWVYRPRNVIYQSVGDLANNWAYGYLIKGPALKDSIFNAIRKETEKLDYLQGILLLLSLAGGTGSGIGSFTMEQLRDHLPTKTIIACTVLPFSSGAVATQNYNTLLTLAKVCELVDLGILFENEQIYSICPNVLKNTGAQLKEINDIISKKLSAVFGPSTESHYNIHHITSTIASHPAFKLATIKSTPYISPSIRNVESSYKWQSYVQHLKQTLKIPMMNSKIVDKETRIPILNSSIKASRVYCKSIGNILITRGMQSKTDSIICEGFEDNTLYPSWIPKSERFTHFHENCKLSNQKKFAALLTNNSQIHKPINTIVDKAWNTFIYSAFLHQYKKYNLEKDDFLQAFTKVENVIEEYKELS